MSSSSSDNSLSTAARRNWWKVGFIVSLFIIEILREAFVLASQPSIQPTRMGLIFSYGDGIAVRGSWTRTDGGNLVPATVSIDCQRARGTCVVADVNVFDDTLNAPEISEYPATFNSEGVVFTNDDPECVRYITSVNLKMKQAFSVRERKPTGTSELCENVLEDRIEMKISDGFSKGPVVEPWKGHFLPILTILRSIFA